MNAVALSAEPHRISNIETKQSFLVDSQTELFTLPKEESSNQCERDILSSSKLSHAKKRVSFKSAWNGQLEESRIICVEETLFEEPTDILGRFLFKGIA
jgi:hypothetical protein